PASVRTSCRGTGSLIETRSPKEVVNDSRARSPPACGRPGDPGGGRRPRAAARALVVAALLIPWPLGGPGRLGLAEAQAATQSSMPAAHVWISTPDGTHRMDDWGSVAFHRGGS